MILSPPEQIAYISCRRMHFPGDRCTFLQKHMVFRGGKARNRRKLQEGFRAQESRTLANFHKKPYYRVPPFSFLEGLCNDKQSQSAVHHPEGENHTRCEPQILDSGKSALLYPEDTFHTHQSAGFLSSLNLGPSPRASAKRSRAISEGKEPPH